MMDAELFDRMPGWLRWVLFVPASVLTYALVFAGVVLGGKLMNFFTTGPGWSDNFFKYLLGPALAGYWSIVAAMILAPHGHRMILWSLLSLWMAAYGVLSGAAIFTGDMKSLFSVLVSVAGALVALSAEDFRA
jgi:hypothetical protein